MASKVGTWTCGKCGTHNAAEMTGCMRCGRPPAYNPWDIAQMSVVAQVCVALLALILFLVVFVAVKGPF